jgi:hypothetical protein
MAVQGVDKEEQLRRLRRICSGLPGTSERPSHGEPTFFAGKKVFAMFSSDHHHDGHVSAIVPAAPGVQEMLVATRPEVFYRPPYVGGKGWVGIELSRIDDDELGSLVTDAWKRKGRQTRRQTTEEPARPDAIRPPGRARVPKKIVAPARKR